MQQAQGSACLVRQNVGQCRDSQQKRGLMSRQITHEEFVAAKRITHPHLRFLSEYQGMRQPILTECLDCHYVWSPEAHSIAKLKKCPRCSGKERLTTKTFRVLMSETQPFIEVLGEYVNTDTPVLCGCKKCGHVWNPRPHHLLHGVGCPECAGVTRKTLEKAQKEVWQVNPDIDIDGEYINNKSPINCTCRKCGCKWTSSVNALLRQKGCPGCNESHGEREIGRVLRKYGLEYTRQKKFDDCVYKRELPFDFYISKMNMVIEFDGQQHFFPVDFGCGDAEKVQKQFELIKKRDSIKNEYCRNNGIMLIRIPYTDYDNIETIIDELLA